MSPFLEMFAFKIFCVRETHLVDTFFFLIRRLAVMKSPFFSMDFKREYNCNIKLNISNPGSNCERLIYVCRLFVATRS